MIKFISPHVELVEEDTPTKHMERVGRTCYRSEDKIKEGSDIAMVKALKRSGHLSVLEHYYFCFRINYYPFCDFLDSLLINKKPYKIDGMRWSFEEDGYVYLSLNTRRIIEMYDRAKEERELKILVFLYDVINEIVEKYPSCKCLFDEVPTFRYLRNVKLVVGDDVPKQHRWHTFRLTSNRGIMAEITRHRKASFSIESTRFCDYRKDMTFCTTDREIYNEYFLRSLQAEYTDLVNVASKDVAREVLPNLLATKINITCFDDYWRDVILPLRYECRTGKAHEQFVCLMDKLVSEYGDIIGYGIKEIFT